MTSSIESSALDSSPFEHPPSVSVVIPCYNEEGNIHACTQEIMRHMSQWEGALEIIFVDDGSSDATLQKILELTSDERIKYVSFSRNFGKESAIVAGLQLCVGEAVIIMDADLQHPPELIPMLLDAYREGYDQVIAKRNRKGDSKLYSFFAQIYYRVIDDLVDVEMVDGAGDYRLLSRRAVDALLSLPENNRFSKGLFSWIGFRQTYIYYENRARNSGKTKWSFKKLLGYGVDGILSFNNKPLRLCIYLGAALIGWGFCT
jgi:glycosyltransferase involved in cell wall biosynthesis